jgi:hypothetical protein
VTFVRIMPDSSEARVLHAAKEDRGWRLRLEREEDAASAYLHEEQVFPERVHRADAKHFREQRSILLREDEQRWLRDALSEMLGEVIDVEGWREEIRRARNGEPSSAMDRLQSVRSLCNYLIHDVAPVIQVTPSSGDGPFVVSRRSQESIALVMLAILDGRELRDCPSCGHPAHYHLSGRERCAGDGCRCTRTCEQVIEAATTAPDKHGSSAGIHCYAEGDGACPERLELSRTTLEQPSHEDDYETLMPALDTAAVSLGWRLYENRWWCPTHVNDKGLVCEQCLARCAACSCDDGPWPRARRP